MEPEAPLEMGTQGSILTVATLTCAALAVTVLLWFLITRPPLSRETKILLFLGLGAFPLAAGLIGDVVAFKHTTERSFCGSCHVMEPWTNDAGDRRSTSLASIHSRNELFGEQSCYVCHADYGMFGLLTTKTDGLRHVWYYYTDFRNDSIEEATPRIHLRRANRNAVCIRCHSMTLPGFTRVADHAGIADRSRRINCASAGCHGPSHPFSKPEEQEGTREE